MKIWLQLAADEFSNWMRTYIKMVINGIFNGIPGRAGDERLVRCYCTQGPLGQQTIHLE